MVYSVTAAGPDKLDRPLNTPKPGHCKWKCTRGPSGLPLLPDAAYANMNATIQNRNPRQHMKSHEAVPL